MAYNILIVDDSRITRTIIAKTVRLAGISIGELCLAENGQEALDVLENNWIDLVLADVNMPVMGGVELVNRMSNDGLLQTIPVVIVSTEGSKARIEEMMEKGVKAYIRKPFTPEIVKDIVKNILEEQHEE